MVVLELRLAALIAALGCAPPLPIAEEATDPPVTSSAAPDDRSLDSLRDPFPPTLSLVDAFEDLVDRVPVAHAFAYAPLHPFHSNGLDKERFAIVPSGTAIELEEEAWSAPVGTVFVKTFVEDGGRPVETRLLRHTSDGWDYGAYLWRDDGTDADLLDITYATPVDVSVGGETFAHEVPSRYECRMCHESSPRPVIGFSAAQLSREDGSVLDAAFAAGVIATRVADLPPIERDDPDLTYVLRYAFGNCGHCHNGLGGGSRAFDLGPDVFLDNTLGVPTTGSGIEVGLRIDPGSPDTSILFEMLAADASGAMPPVGRQQLDRDAIEVFRRFIASLGMIEPGSAP